MRALSLVVASRDRRFDSALESSGKVAVSGHAEHPRDLFQLVVDTRPAAVLVSLEEDPDAVFDALDKLLAPKPLLLFCGPDDSRLILRAMRAGAYEYIAPGPEEADQLVAAVHRATASSIEAQPSALLAMIGSKGGVGTSFAACQLGASLARMDGRAALVDGNLRHGDIALYLDLSPRYDLASLATRDESVDLTNLHSALAAHPTGVAVLAAPRDPEEADAVTASCFDNVLELLQSDFDWVIWDMPHDFDDRSLRVIDRADVILLVTTPDVPALSHTRTQLELLARLGRDESDVRIVLNRTGSNSSVSMRDAESFLKRPVDANIPNDYPLASASLNEGRTVYELAPRSSIGAAVTELSFLAHDWCGRPSPQRQRRGLLDRLRGR